MTWDPCVALIWDRVTLANTGLGLFIILCQFWAMLLQLVECSLLAVRVVDKVGATYVDKWAKSYQQLSSITQLMIWGYGGDMVSLHLSKGSEFLTLARQATSSHGSFWRDE